MRQLSKKRGVTLIELILAIVLLSVVVLTGISIELGMRRILASTDVEVLLLDEAAPIMTLATKITNQGIGDITDSPYQFDTPSGNQRYLIRIDSNVNGRADAGDIWCSFLLITSGVNQYQLRFYPDASDIGTLEVLTNRCVSFQINTPVDGSSSISLTLRKDPASAVTYTNPQISLHTIAQYRSASCN